MSWVKFKVASPQALLIWPGYGQPIMGKKDKGQALKIQGLATGHAQCLAFVLKLLPMLFKLFPNREPFLHHAL